VNQKWYVGFDVLTSVVMKSYIFWNLTPYIPVKNNDISKLLSACSGFLLGLLFSLEDRGDMFL
jgi:hypothetical protein